MKKINEIIDRYLLEDAEPGNRKEGEGKKFAVEFIVRSSGKTKTIYIHANSASEARQKATESIKKFKLNNPEAGKLNWSYNSVEEV